MDWRGARHLMRDTAGQFGGVLRKHWRTLAVSGIGLAAGAALFTVMRSSHGASAVATPYPHDLAQVNFAVAGDVIPHEAVRSAAAAAGDGQPGWTALFSDVSNV